MENDNFFVYIFGGLDFAGHFFAYYANVVFFRDVWFWTKRSDVQ